MSKEIKKIRIVVCGAAGRMGQAVLRIAADWPEVEFVGALVRRGTKVSSFAKPHLYTPVLDASVDADVVIDFSGDGGFDAALRLAVDRNIPMVSGSTGLSNKQLSAMATAAQSIPLLWASNFSLGVAVLAHLAAQAALLLPGWDCEIIEAHHRHKIDAPSGTALMLGKRINAERGRANDGPDTDRSGERQHGSIGYSVSRAGDIIGEHEVRLASDFERLELIHRAGNRDLFARGALEAACWIIGKPVGRHEMADVLGLRSQ